jgi:hypothetical protein
MMIDSWVKQKSMEVLALMTLAVTTWRLYPPKNPMVVNTIGSLHEALETLFQKEKSLIFTETEKSLLIYNEQISQHELKQPRIAALFELMINFEIKSVTINHGVTKVDLSGFVDILAQQPETIKLSGGINKVVAERKIAHILLDQKVYIAKSSKHKLLASLDIHDDEIIQYITGANQQLDLDVDQVREMAQNSEWMEQIFKNGMNQIKSQRYMPNSQLSENMVRMISMLDLIVDKTDQEKFSRLIAKSIADLEEDMIGLILSQDIEHYFNGKILQDVLDQLESGKIDRVMDIVYNKLKHSKPLPGRDDPVLFSSKDEQSYQRLHESDKKKMLQQIKDAEKKRKEKKIYDLKQEIAPLLAGREESFLNTSLMDSLAGIVNDLTVHGQHDTVEAIIGRLAEALLSERQDVRDNASASLVKVIESLPEQRQQAVVERLSTTLMRWIQLETSATEAHKKLSSRLKDQMVKLIKENRYVECLPLLNAFHLIDYGFLEKNENIQKTAANIINALSGSYRLDLLFAAYVNSGDQEKMDIGRILARLGKVSLSRLMDMLRDHPDSDERIRILNLIKEIGPAAMPLIKERSLKDFPWYHHRNLAYLLRFINGHTTVDVLQTLLRHKHQKVRQEALESLYLIGESERGPVFLSLLSTADDSFKISIIEMLGKIRYKEAAPVLMEMLKDRPLLAAPARKDMEEAICIALGKIGTPEAATLLTEISKQKFYSITSYSERVRKAAAKALMSISP